MSSFLWRDSARRKLFNQVFTQEEFERRKVRRELAREQKQQKDSVSVLPVRNIVVNTFNRVKKFLVEQNIDDV